MNLNQNHFSSNHTSSDPYLNGKLNEENQNNAFSGYKYRYKRTQDNSSNNN